MVLESGMSLMSSRPATTNRKRIKRVRKLHNKSYLSKGSKWEPNLIVSCGNLLVLICKLVFAYEGVGSAVGSSKEAGNA